MFIRFVGGEIDEDPQVAAGLFYYEDDAQIFAIPSYGRMYRR